MEALTLAIVDVGERAREVELGEGNWERRVRRSASGGGEGGIGEVAEGATWRREIGDKLAQPILGSGASSLGRCSDASTANYDLRQV